MASLSSSSTYLIQFHHGGGKNGNVLDIYVSHTVFELHDAINVEQNDDSDSDLDGDYNIYEFDSESEESDTIRVDHLSDGEEEVYDARTRKPDLAPKKSEKYESPDQLKRPLAFYALANGYKLYYEVNNLRILLAKCCRDEKDKNYLFRLWASWMQNEKSFQIKKLNDKHACSRTYEYGTLITSNWIARNYTKKIMINPCTKVKEIIDLILKKYKCKGGGVRTRGGGVRTRGGGVRTRGGGSLGKQRSTNKDDHSGSSSSNKLRSINGKVVRQRGRGDGSKSRMYLGGIRTIGFGLQNSMGLPKHTCPPEITLEACIIHAQSESLSEIALTQSKPRHKDEEPRHEDEEQVQPKFLIKMPPRRTMNINDVYKRIMTRMEERLDQFVDQFANRMNDMMNQRRCKDRNGRRSKDEVLGNPFFEGDCSSSNEWGDYGVAGDDYEGSPVFDDDYEEAPVFDDDQFEEESMMVYDTDIEDVIEEEEGFVRKGGFGEE
ncbi:hypothetical protein Tco_0822825 [Tanacetum coccineum]|uniref:Uncharacterized protein n=1 Tax=Tanacetum coccineum TaxID=301880 RepID=A0ABQ5AG60_9ASTR